MKKYKVTLSMRYSTEVIVKASTVTEAKRKAKQKKLRLKPSDWKIDVESHE